MKRSLLWGAALGLVVAGCGDDSSGSGGAGGGAGGGASTTGSGSTTTSSSTSGQTTTATTGGAGGEATTGSGGAGGDSTTSAGGGGVGGGAGSGLETSHGGLELGEWMKAYWTWALGGNQEGFIDDRVFLELPLGTDDDGDGVYVGQIDFALAAADGWAVPMQAWIGETYLNGDPVDDDPNGFPLEEVFTSMDVVLTLDDEVIIDSADGNLADFYWDSIPFDETIAYDVPTDYGAIGAIWSKGIGYLHAPLTPGVHVVHLVEFNTEFGIGFDNTWTITVE